MALTLTRLFLVLLVAFAAAQNAAAQKAAEAAAKLKEWKEARAASSKKVVDVTDAA